MKRIVIFASGSGSNAENLIKFFHNRENASVIEVLTNNPHAKVLERCKNLNVNALSFNRVAFSKSKDIDFDVKAVYKEIFAQGLRSKIVLERSIEQHAKICVENSEDVFDARILAKQLKEEIEYRVRQYSYCIMNNTKNYKEWLEEDYERKLRLKISQMFAAKM